MKKTAFLLSIILCLYGCGKGKQKAYLVEETNYIHSSKDKSDCKFIEQVDEKGFHIKKVDLELAPYYKYEICKQCFSPTQVNAYTEKIAKLKEREAKEKYEKERRDSLVNSVSEETRQAIIDDYIESLENEYDEMGDYGNDYRTPRYRD